MSQIFVDIFYQLYVFFFNQDFQGHLKYGGQTSCCQIDYKNVTEVKMSIFFRWDKC